MESKTKMLGRRTARPHDTKEHEQYLVLHDTPKGTTASTGKYERRSSLDSLRMKNGEDKGAALTSERGVGQGGESPRAGGGGGNVVCCV